jgi:wobble nucleotide-excising tRNase
MSKTLSEIAQQLIDANKKVQLIYAFNGTGKTRLSLELKKLISTKSADDVEDFDAIESVDNIGNTRSKFLYYNAFTEDLFYWDNDLINDAEPKLKIQTNSFTDWIFKDQGQDQNIITNFQRYANNKLTPSFNQEYKRKDKDGKDIIIPAFSEVTFSLQRGDNTDSGNIKISKGEESNFIWSIFYTLLDKIITILKEPEEERAGQFDGLEYVFVDDPVSSLDENHLIELAVNLADLINSAPVHLKFIITTHSPLFYNVLHHELNMSDKSRKNGCYLLERFEDGTFNLDVKGGSANKSFSYHLHIKKLIEEAYEKNKIEKFHFTLLRNLYEKTCGFLGYKQWTDLLPEDARDSYKRIINTYSHRHLSYEEKTEPSPQEKQTVKFLLDHLLREYAYYTETENAATN